MKFRPLHDRVLIRRIDEDERSAGGIIIPDTAKEKPMQGEVLATGSGARNEKGEITPLDVQVGDRVRARAKVLQARRRAGALLLTSETRIEVENERKPACVAETLGMYFFGD